MGSREEMIDLVLVEDHEMDTRRCYELGANSYVVKPVNFEELTRAVADLGYYWILVNEPADG